MSRRKTNYFIFFGGLRRGIVELRHDALDEGDGYSMVIKDAPLGLGV